MHTVQAAQHPTFADFGAATHSHGQFLHTPCTVCQQTLVIYSANILWSYNGTGHGHAYSQMLTLSAHHEKQVVPMQPLSKCLHVNHYMKSINVNQ